MFFISRHIAYNRLTYPETSCIAGVVYRNAGSRRIFDYSSVIVIIISWIIKAFGFFLCHGVLYICRDFCNPQAFTMLQQKGCLTIIELYIVFFILFRHVPFR